MPRTVKVIAHDFTWPEQFRVEAADLARVLEPEVIAIHHIGSTAIPGIKAKPIIDMLVEVHDIVLIAGYDSAMTGLGYESKGEVGIPGRRYFSRDTEGVRTHQVHIFERGDPQIERHVLFVDFLIAHPVEAQAYGELKAELATRYPTDPYAYNEAKTAFIQAVDRQAIVWKKSQAGLDRSSRTFYYPGSSTQAKP